MATHGDGADPNGERIQHAEHLQVALERDANQKSACRPPGRLSCIIMCKRLLTARPITLTSEWDMLEKRLIGCRSQIG